MNYAWVIDQTKCIGCHACSTACKSENEVPLGVYRTWVKNVEVGAFPNVRRHFAVLRCNHCADPPCVHICPVTAMFQRADGIVDIDHQRCIGCKACMQACPYDAIHIDPSRDTAAKCHFCAHRVDRGLLPACVIVCPVEALVFGDLDDATSRVSRVLGSKPVTVRRPEQGTRPKAFYVGAHAATLDPLAAAHESSYMWADRSPGSAKDHSADLGVWSLLGSPGNGGDHRSGRSRMPTARVAYDVSHQITWREKVSAYLWTKSVAAGAAFVAAAAILLGADPESTTFAGATAPLIALFALVVTGILLIADLKRPERFWFILARPQWGSWLTRGAFLITAYGALLAVWLGLTMATAPVGPWLLIPTGVLGIGVAVYTAFLFGQCEARDLWQSPLLAVTLAIQMIIAGSAALLLATVVSSTSRNGVAWAETVLTWSLVAHAAAVLMGEVAARHGSANASAAAYQMTRGRYAPWFWAALALGTAGPLLLLVGTPAGGFAGPAAAALALAGLWMYEHAFVMAGQAVPIS